MIKIDPQGILSWLFKWFRRPKIVILFEYKLGLGNNENEYCHLRPFPLGTSQLFTQGWFFRVGIKNKGKDTIQQCDVKIEKMQQLSQNQLVPVSSFSPFFLHWANRQNDDSIDISSQETVFVDIVHTIMNNQNFIFFAKGIHSMAGIQLNRGPGIYTLDLRVISKNVGPKNFTMKIENNSNWDQLLIYLLKPS